MSRSQPWGAAALSILLGAGIALLLAAGLSGCAGNQPVAEPVNKTYTASDEPESRKRSSNRLQLAVLYSQDGKFTYALDEVKQAINADPNWFEPYWMRGLVEMQVSDHAAAEVSFRRALELNPDAPDLQHNYGVLLCKTNRAAEGLRKFDQILANPAYGQRAKTYLEQGNCLLGLGQKNAAEASFMKSYELDAANPMTGYRLSSLLFERNEDTRADFYIRRINNSEGASAESLWLGIKIARRMGNPDAAEQLAVQLRKRFGTSHEAAALERGAFNE